MVTNTLPFEVAAVQAGLIVDDSAAERHEARAAAKWGVQLFIFDIQSGRITMPNPTFIRVARLVQLAFQSEEEGQIGNELLGLGIAEGSRFTDSSVLWEPIDHQSDQHKGVTLLSDWLEIHGVWRHMLLPSHTEALLLSIS